MAKGFQPNRTTKRDWYKQGKQGDKLRKLKRYQEAIASYDKVIAVKPNYYLAWYNRGLALAELGRYQEAIASYDKVIAVKPDYHEAWFNQGIVQWKLGQYEEAIACYDKVIEIQPDCYDAWNNRGGMLHELGRYQEAITCYDKALEFKPNDYLAWYNRGDALSNLKRHQEALACYDKALKFKPDDHLAWYNRGLSFSELGRHQEALTSYDKALEFKPDDYPAWNNRGLTLGRVGHYREALASFDKAIEFKPDSHEAWNNRGNVLSDLGQYEEAIASYDKAIAIKPDFYQAWIVRGIELGKLGHYQDALASFDKAIEIKPDYYDAWENRGVALAKLKRYEEAIASYDEALRLTNNQSWHIWDNRGIAVFKFQGYEAAVNTWNDGILSLQSDTPDYHQGCGELHRTKGFYQYDYGKQQPNPFPYWFDAKDSYQKALDFLAFEQFPQRHLEVLQDLLKVCDFLGDTQTVEARLEKGSQHLEELLPQCQSEGQKITLARKFAAFNQLRVDILAQSSDPQKQIEALELAEKRKNTCLGWLRYGWDYVAPSPNYQQIQEKLLNSRTALIYWHLSPAAITTFILRYKQPLIVQTLKPDDPAHFNICHLEAFEEWMASWKGDYQNYRKDAKGLEEAKTRERWREQIPVRLKQLGDILGIDEILTQLGDETQLILIPHRDLHLLPLHYLLCEQDFTITYLPSAQIGINLQLSSANPGQLLLNVENPQNDLRHATVESAAVGLMYPNSLPPIKGQQATKTQIMTALQSDERLGVFHFTGHGEHDINQPLESSLLLAGEDKLTLRDIFQLDFSRYHLICLSACETALTSKQGLIDEFVGLISGFLAKGAAYVVSTLWAVDERSTALLMVRFYQCLQANMTPPSALKAAQKWLRTVTHPQLIEWYQDLAAEFEGKNSTIQSYLNRQVKRLQKDSATINPDPPLYAHPYYWAGFTVTGKV